MKIDLGKLETIARAADKDNPGICYNADHVDGYPIAQSAMDLFNAMDPATVVSLIRYIRRLEAGARTACDSLAGQHPWADLVALLDMGAIQYGRAPCGRDERWDIDRLAEDDSEPRSRPAVLHAGACESPTGEIVYNECKISRADAEAVMAELRTNPPPPTQIVEVEGVYTRVPVHRGSNGFTVLASSDTAAPVTKVDLGALLPGISVSPGVNPQLDPAAVAAPSVEQNDKPSIAELQKIAHQVRFAGLPDSARIGAAVLVEVAPVLLEIAAAALTLEPELVHHLRGPSDRLLAALAKVTP